MAPFFVILISFVFLGKINHMILAEEGDFGSIVFSLNFVVKVVGIGDMNMFQFLVVNVLSIGFFLITLACLVEMFALTFLGKKKIFPFLPRFEKHMGYFIVDEHGKPIESGSKITRRNILTFGVFYAGPVLTGVLAGAGLKIPALVVLGLWVVYWIFQVFWIESNSKQRSFHDWLLNLWKLETRPELTDEMAKPVHTYNVASLEVKSL